MYFLPIVTTIFINLDNFIFIDILMYINKEYSGVIWEGGRIEVLPCHQRTAVGTGMH